MSVYGNKVKRILPRINEELNEDWLTNKARYIYDSFDSQRVITPMLNLNKFTQIYLNLTLGPLFRRIWVSLSWESSLEFLVYLLNSIKINFTLNLASDLETVNSFKFTLSSMGLLDSYSGAVDYSSLYFSAIRIKELEHYQLFVSLNSYLRIEIPLLNTRVRKSYNHYMSGFKFLAAGVGLSYFTYPVKLVSNNKLSTLRFLNGKLFFSRFLALVKNKAVIFYNNSSYYFLPSFFTKIFNPVTINVQSSISSLTAKHAGLFLSPNYSSSEFYMVGANIGSSVVPLVYQGSHGVPVAANSLLILPTAIFVEKTSNYLNIEGSLQKAHAATTCDRLIKKDWEVFAALFEFNSVTLQN